MRCLALIVLLTSVAPFAASAQGIEDLVSENIYACDRDQGLAVTLISREAGRPWLAVAWVEGKLVTMQNEGTLEAPVFRQVNASDTGSYDWRPVSEAAAELGWTPAEGKRQVILRCDTSGEGGA